MKLSFEALSRQLRDHADDMTSRIENIRKDIADKEHSLAIHHSNPQSEEEINVIQFLRGEVAGLRRALFLLEG